MAQPSLRVHVPLDYSSSIAGASIHGMTSRGTSTPSVAPTADDYSAYDMASDDISEPSVVHPADEQRLVIGLDYGTTYTGVAFATPRGNHAVTINEIDHVQDWEGKVDHKVPSVLSYSSMAKNWGSSLSPDAVAMIHTKLELDPQSVDDELDLILSAMDGMKNFDFQYVKATTFSQDFPDKSPEDIVTDYLTNVFEHLLKTVDKFTEELRERISTDIVLTMPTVWSYRAKNSTFRAFTKAGFNKEYFPMLKEVIIVSEPEAAAIYTARHFQEAARSPAAKQCLKPKECFILCDAGGGTVDVVSYKVKSLAPSFELERIGLPSGKKCGSIFIDRAFKLWLRNLLGEKRYHEIDPHTNFNKISSHVTEGREMRKLMKEFDTFKRAFHENHAVKRIDLPPPLHNLTLEGKVNLGQITITNAQMRQFFDPCIIQIIGLIHGHMNQIQQRGSRTKNVFLVGGFGASKYLEYQLQRTLHMRNIAIWRPDDPWVAVVRGAALCGIEKDSTRNLVTASGCRRSYGIVIDKPFSDVENKVKDRTPNPLNNNALAKDQLHWLINKGDLILSSSPKEAEANISVSFVETGHRFGKVKIYSYSDDDNRPETVHDAPDELEIVKVLEFNLTGHPLTEFEERPRQFQPPYYVAALKLKMSLNGEDLQAELTWKDKTIDIAADIMY